MAQDYDSMKENLKFVRDVMKLDLLDRETEKELAIAWSEDGDKESLHKLTAAYLRLVVSIALKFRHYGLPMADLFQEGTVGLMVAASRFDPHVGVRFSTYGKWWIKAYIQDYILKNWSIVRTGSTTAHKQLFFNLKRLKNKLLDINQDFLTDEQKDKVCEALKVSVNDVTNIENRLMSQDFSLSAKISIHGEDHWQDFIEDERPTPEDTTVENHDKDVQRLWIDDAFDCLTEREQYIIEQRRLSDDPLKLHDIGKDLDITKERVRQIENKALRKMKHYLATRTKEVFDIFKQ